MVCGMTPRAELLLGLAPVLALALGLGLTLSACLGGKGPKPPADLRLRVMSFNVKHGIGLGKRPLAENMARQAAILRREQPDLLALQEIDEGTQRVSGMRQTSWFAAELGMPAQAFAKFMDYDGGEYGLAVLSRFADAESQRLVLPPGKREPRAACVHIITPRPGLRLAFVCVHFDWLRRSAERVAQARALIARLDALQLPCIVAGDYNDVPDSETCALFRAAGFSLLPKANGPATFPGTRGAEIDHVALRGTPGVRLVGAPIRILEEDASDHYPIVTEVRVQERE